MNELARLNASRRHEVTELRDALTRQWRQSERPASTGYPLADLKARITQTLEQWFDQPDLVWELDILDRAKFGADIAVRVTSLLKQHGAKTYIADHVPAIAAALHDASLADAVAEVHTKGIYVNLRLADAWFLGGVSAITRCGEDYGLGDAMSDRTFVVDYSSPNVAKTLHAGHLRSTMIGHVLGNLYEACGALVYRVNHINDFGGFGFMLEGYRRFADRFPEGMTGNDRLLTIYALRRALERVVSSDADLNDDVIDPADREILTTYLPGLRTADELLKFHNDFTAAADARFQALEEGAEEEVVLWRQMVEWSLADFAAFYQALDIDIDFTIGESFYFQAGDSVIDAALADGRAVRLTEDMVRERSAELDQAVASEEMTPQARDQAVVQLHKDLGAIVVPLHPGGERLVVRRSDGRSIYATRDVGAIQLRRDIFDPTDIVYVVGQEQQVHFSRLFAAAEALGVVEPGEVCFKHIYFGFYVDADSNKKLSSRDSVASVNELLAESVEHYRTKTAQGGGHMSAEDIEQAARQLAVGAVFFNDLKKDMKGPVPIARGDLAPTIAAFEKSGGPYVVYSAVRARSILRKYGTALPEATEVGNFDLSDAEALLILRLLEYPEVVVKAAKSDDPAVLVRYLLEIAGLYNAYYAAAPVLRGAEANLFRILVTRSVELTLVNGLSLCHVQCPPQI